MSDGELPQGWTWTTVTELGTPSQQAVLTGPFGASLGREDFVSVGVPVLTIGCLTEAGLSLSKAMYTTTEKAQELDRYQVQVGDVLFSRMASVGRADVVTAAFAGTLINYHLMRLRLASEAIIPSYFVYFVRGSNAVTDYVRDVNHGATRDGINTNQLLAMPVLLPPLAEQRRIVATIEEQFTRLDAGVAALKWAQAALKRYRAAVLKAAVEGKLTASWRTQHPDVQPAAGLLADILAERRARWEADLRAKGKDPAKARYDEPQSPQTEGLPELPQGWVWATVEQVYDVIGGVTKGRDLSQRAIVSVPYLRVANVQRGYLDLSVVKCIDVPDDELPRYLLQNGDILLTEGGDADKLGRAAVWSGQVEACIHQNHIFRARSFVPQIRSWWLAFYANSEQGQGYFRKSAKQTVNLASINLTQLRKCPLPLPSSDEQQEIVAEVEQRLSVVSVLEATIAANLKRAERLRRAILERAFTGRLVPQDPADEPASALLERIRQEREAATNERTRNGRPDGQPAAVVASQKPLWE